MIALEIKYNKRKRYKKVQIPTFDELTTEQYMKFKECKIQDRVSFLSIVLNISRENAYNLYIKDSRKMDFLLEEEKNFELYKPNKKYYLGYELKDISTLGQRYSVIRNSPGYEGFKLYVFFAAVALANTDELDIIDDIYKKLLNQNYYEVMGLGFFLLKIFEIGMIKELPILKRLPKLIRMKISKFKRELKSLISLLFITKYKHYVNY